MLTSEEIKNYFKNWNLDESSQEYLRFHGNRYELLFKEIDKLLDKTNNLGENAPKILDIGPAYQTEILRATLPSATINSLGFEDARFKLRQQDKHIQFDLNDAQYQENWPRMDEHDIVILAETIEHLYTSPRLVLSCITSWLKKDGVLIIQTPNAVSLRRRLKMLGGKCPVEMIREKRTDPGHFREYTIEELVSTGKEVGLDLYNYSISNYFNYHHNFPQTIYNVLTRILPMSFRDGIMVCLRKE